LYPQRRCWRRLPAQDARERAFADSGAREMLLVTCTGRAPELAGTCISLASRGGEQAPRGLTRFTVPLLLDIQSGLIAKDEPIVCLQKADLRKADLAGADLREANLSEADLREADLREAMLMGVYAEMANLRVARLDGADLVGADLDRANLVGATLAGADVRLALLREATLQMADLHRADLRKASLIGADLAAAALDGVLLEGANLAGADLTDALRTTEAQLNKAESLSRATLPDGTTHP